MSDWYSNGMSSGTAWFSQFNRPVPAPGVPDQTLCAKRYEDDIALVDTTTLAQIRLAWERFESATTMGEIQAALAEVSRLVHDGH